MLLSLRQFTGFGCKSCHIGAQNVERKPGESFRFFALFEAVFRILARRFGTLVPEVCAHVRSTSSPHPMVYDSYGAKKRGSGERCGNRISLCPPFLKSHAVCRSVAQNIPLREQFTARCLTGESRFPEVLTCDAAFDRVR